MGLTYATEEGRVVKRLFVDLDICDNCPECVVDCSYFYHPGNNGITELREKAAFALICRHCKEGTCVIACPNDALERGEDGILKRSNMLCIKCNSCVVACPFGTIQEGIIPFLTSGCDVCVGRVEDADPVCVSTCPYGALKYGEFSEDPENRIYVVRGNVIVHTTSWERE